MSIHLRERVLRGETIVLAGLAVVVLNFRGDTVIALTTFVAEALRSGGFVLVSLLESPPVLSTGDFSTTTFLCSVLFLRKVLLMGETVLTDDVGFREMALVEVVRLLFGFGVDWLPVTSQTICVVTTANFTFFGDTTDGGAMRRFIALLEACTVLPFIRFVSTICCNSVATLRRVRFGVEDSNAETIVERTSFLGVTT